MTNEIIERTIKRFDYLQECFHFLGLEKTIQIYDFLSRGPARHSHIKKECKISSQVLSRQLEKGLSLKLIDRQLIAPNKKQYNYFGLKLESSEFIVDFFNLIRNKETECKPEYIKGIANLLGKEKAIQIMIYFYLYPAEPAYVKKYFKVYDKAMVDILKDGRKFDFLKRKRFVFPEHLDIDPELYICTKCGNKLGEFLLNCVLSKEEQDYFMPIFEAPDYLPWIK